MKLTGKYLGTNESSFIEFEVDGDVLDNETKGELQDELSCYEAYWQGKSDLFKGNSIMIGMDEADESDIDAICEHLDEAGAELIRDKFEYASTVRF